MKKSLVIILAVAIIGALGMMAKSNDKAAPLTAAPQNQGSGTVAGANTTDSSQAPGSSAGYKDGTYSGDSEETPYGTVQVAAVVSGGKISDIKFLRMPGPEGHSKEVTAFAEPYLKGETLQLQTAHIQFVSGATQTSEAYAQSLQAALDQAA